MGKWSFIYKTKGGIRSRWSDLLEEGRILTGKKYAGVRTAAAYLGELDTKGEKEAKQRQPVWNNFELEKWKIS